MEYITQLEQKNFDDQKLNDLKSTLIKGREEIKSAIEYAKSRGGIYIELIARRLVDAAIAILIGHYLLAQANKNDRKKIIAETFITRNESQVIMNCSQVKSGNTQVVDQYKIITTN
ncbi:MAG: hypothetical protein LBQ66_05280 [Planctomycetaceae bacterium]|nr:hypothetical protein [Planctomycetaceae bacterium]